MIDIPPEMNDLRVELERTRKELVVEMRRDWAEMMARLEAEVEALYRELQEARERLRRFDWLKK